MEVMLEENTCGLEQLVILVTEETTISFCSQWSKGQLLEEKGIGSTFYKMSWVQGLHPLRTGQTAVQSLMLL